MSLVLMTTPILKASRLLMKGSNLNYNLCSSNPSSSNMDVNYAKASIYIASYAHLVSLYGTTCW